MTLLLIVILFALVFEFINGFHDAANAIATVVSTKVLTPRQAVILASVFNLVGAMTGMAVATTVGKGLVDTNSINLTTILCGLFGGTVWNLVTWWYGLPSSSSHALIGGLCGAALASAHDNWAVLLWSGLWKKVLVPMFTSPLAGFMIGFVLMSVLLVGLRDWRPRVINAIFNKLQILSSAYMGFSHGTNDAQKTMGIIALTLFTCTKSGALNDLPSWLKFLHTPQFQVAVWIKVICAVTMGAGTMAGGWRIIRTLGHHMVRMRPIEGFAAQTTSATVLLVAAHFGMPVSTTHAASTSIMGVGATKRLGAMKWGVVSRIVWAWVLTLPLCGLMAYGTLRLAQLFGWTP